MAEGLIWIGVLVCVSQSAMFSGLNLALFSLNPLLLEVEVENGNEAAARALELRRDSNLALATVLIGNVAVNVLLTLLSESLLAGVGAFLFSTIIITAFGELLPQAYFSRYAVKVVAYLSPLFRFYRFLLYPVAKPVAMALDWMLGREPFRYLKEEEVQILLERYMDAKEADISRTEGQGAINFLSADDLRLEEMGEVIHPRSIIAPPHGLFELGGHDAALDDWFLQAVNASGKKWVTLTDEDDNPCLVLDADGFLRDAIFTHEVPDIESHCHSPIVVKDGQKKLGSVLRQLEVHMKHDDDHVIDRDVILVWGQTRRIITGADILGQLLKDIAKPVRTHLEGREQT